MDVTGNFYGPAAQEVGGLFRITGNNGQGQGAIVGHQLSGSPALDACWRAAALGDVHLRRRPRADPCAGQPSMPAGSPRPSCSRLPTSWPRKATWPARPSCSRR